MAANNTLSSSDQLAKLSSSTLKEKTGRDWAEWIEWLDNLKSDGRTHKDIVTLLTDHVESTWYRQKIALGYREATGQRQLGELLSGYEVGVSRTFPVSAKKAWELIASEEGLSTWLGALADGRIGAAESFSTRDGIIGTITVFEPGSHFRMAWKPEYWRYNSTLQVRVTGSKSKSAGKSVISFHHEKLPRAADRDAMKRHWEEKLSDLAQIIKGKSGSL
ncbi:Uncharacterized conserved protein YndB, AHSA1/START domain [Dyadobacter sp. SG02]|uniref:hypothetical protein n=1 Tax=Dyadobacter sp. SG02 TaxID=1855291 RepID=UPI0008AFA47C|nr:hypothetical protein [Dyadobacter sp. SG02]SEJ62903.1 Uncharacterized conserved protein YndB, AHSA1/START domain [Dyadobacter sp. SG02]